MTQAWAIKGLDGEVVNLELSEGDTEFWKGPGYSVVAGYFVEGSAEPVSCDYGYNEDGRTIFRTEPIWNGVRASFTRDLYAAPPDLAAKLAEARELLERWTHIDARSFTANELSNATNDFLARTK